MTSTTHFHSITISELRSKYFETPINNVNQALDELSGQITLFPADPFACKRPIMQQQSSPFPVPTSLLPNHPPISSTGSLSTHEYRPQSCDEAITSF